MKTEYLLIGEVVRPQGIRGELKLRADSQDPSRYAALRTVWLREGERYVPRRVLSGRASGRSGPGSSAVRESLQVMSPEYVHPWLLSARIVGDPMVVF